MQEGWSVSRLPIVRMMVSLETKKEGKKAGDVKGRI